MPVGSGKCFCCVNNTKALNAILIYDVISIILIVTIPRAVAAMHQL